MEDNDVRLTLRDAILPSVSLHQDEIDALRVGEEFLNQQAALHTDKLLRRVPQPDDATQALPFKGVALMDDVDRMLAVYLVNRDAMNRTRLSLISMQNS